MSDEKMRAEFEAWYADHFSRARGVDCSAEIIASMREGDLYGDRGYLNGCWIGWQASRAALVVELPTKISEFNTDENGFVNPAAAEHDEAIDDCRDAIEAAGVRVKP